MEQVLDVNHFDVINPGQTRDDVLRRIGRPSERAGMHA